MTTKKEVEAPAKEVKALVTEVKPENTVSYGGVIVGFYDNPRTLKDKNGNDIIEDRIYVDKATPNAKQQHVRRKAHEDDIQKFGKAFKKYLEAKERGDCGTSASDLLEKDKEIEELRKQLSAKQNEVKTSKTN